MHLYDCRADDFIPQASAGQIADVLRQRFRDRLDQNPSESEVRSWHNSLGAFADSISGAGMDDAWIVLEYQLPLSSSRLDCMVLGSNPAGADHAVVLEFKQWDRVQPSYIPEVVNLGNIPHLHPSAQARAYREYLRDTHDAFASGSIDLASCAYLHNVGDLSGSGFYDERYAGLLLDSPAFSATTVDDLTGYIHQRTGQGAARETVQRVLRGRYRPSKALLDHVADSIAGYEPWQLLDEQRIVFNHIFADIQRAREQGGKQVIIIKGGPGTGKSVIAVQVVGAAARDGYSVAHATGSKAFTTNMRGIVRREAPFLYTHNFRDTLPNDIDLIIVDEAHRLRHRTQFGPRIYSHRPQAEEIVDAAKVSVFLLDQQQSVRKNEVGSVFGISDYAESQNISVIVYDLLTQFRCAGSDSYIRWVEHALGLSHESSLAWQRNNEYEVKIFSDVADMEAALQDRHDDGQSARMVAGFCWDWSDPIREDNTLVHDVVIGDWSKPWNRKPREMLRKGKGTAPKPENHPYKIWASEPEGFAEVGCIYSAQGFEFDYVGVIVGKDLVWDPQRKAWHPELSQSKDSTFKRGLTKDPELAVEKLAHIYRVLSTRGMKGTYFYFLDKATQAHFESLLSQD